MSEQPLTPVQPGAGQPQAQTGQPMSLTQEQLATLLEQTKAAAVEEAFRRAQGYYEKGQVKVQERMRQMEATLKAAGVTVDDQTRDRMKQAIAAEVSKEPETPPAGTPTGSQQAGQPEKPPENLDPISTEAYAMQRQAGVFIEDNDPELSMIEQTSPYAFLRSIERAIEAKKARISRQRVMPAAPAIGAGGTPDRWSGQSGLQLLNQHFTGKR